MSSEVRTAVLKASRELLDLKGPDGLSMREAARRAGVSHQAPYHHFADRGDILAELVREGFAELAAATSAAMETDGPRERRIHALGEAYTRFALSNPALFNLMFRSDIVDLERYPHAHKVARQAFDLLVSAIAEGAPGDDRALRTRVVTAWALVHGLASLAIDRELAGTLGEGFAPGSGDLSQLVSDVLTGFARQMAAEETREPKTSAPGAGNRDHLPAQKT